MVPTGKVTGMVKGRDTSSVKRSGAEGFAAVSSCSSRFEFVEARRVDLCRASGADAFVASAPQPLRAGLNSVAPLALNETEARRRRLRERRPP